ncbi:MAG: DUF448 domain-containing protein [Deltaproteobacteria bacterium]|nr:DUF448 domain-containing protein [Deltaproteobacteria bacterium]
MPHRTCIGCREAFEKTALIRIVQSPDGRLVPDLKAKLPGRGVYLCSRPSCLQKAVRKNLLSRALRSPVPASELAGLEEKICGVLENKIRSFLSVLRKGNRIVAGRESIQKRIHQGEVYLLILAEESSKKRAGYERKNIPLRIFFSRERLGRAVGKAPQPVLGVLDERASLELIRWIDWVDGFCAGRG